MSKAKLNDFNRVLAGMARGATFDGKGPPSDGWIRYALRHPDYEPIIIRHRTFDEIRQLLDYDNGSYVLNDLGKAVAADIDLPIERCMQPYKITTPEDSLKRRARETMKKLFSRGERLRLDSDDGNWEVQPMAEKGWKRYWGCRRIDADEMALLAPYIEDFDDTSGKPSKRLNAAGVALLAKRGR